MKKLYTLLLCMAATLSAAAQQSYLGYASPNETIYPYDGLSTEVASHVGAAIRISSDMLEPWVGCKITALMLGWDMESKTGKYDAFVTRKLGSNEYEAYVEKTTVKFGWNTISLSEGVTITEDMEELYVGMYADVKAGECFLPKFYPHAGAGQGYLFQEGDVTEDGSEAWYDLNDLGFDMWEGTTLAILAVVTDEDGSRQNKLQVSDMRYDIVVEETGTSGQNVSTAYVNIKNVGSNSVTSLTVACRNGDQEYTSDITLTSALEAPMSKWITAPICAFGSGEQEYLITKVNGQEVSDPKVFTTNQILIPSTVAAQHVKTNLLEFYCSETVDCTPTFYESYLKAGIEPWAEKYIIVQQHVADQFMLGDDEGVQMMLSLADNDSTKIYLPSHSINRTLHMANFNSSSKMPIDYVWYPYGWQMFGETVSNTPTFIRMETEAWLTEDKDEVAIEVRGDAALGVMPEGESLYCTAYLLEDGIESDSQEFESEEQAEECGGIWVHENVARRRFTPMFGTEVETGEDGSFELTLSTRINSKWNPANMHVVAFVHRGFDNDIYHRNVLQTVGAKVETGEDDAVRDVKAGAKADNKLYDLSGRSTTRPAHGLYIQGGKKRIY